LAVDGPLVQIDRMDALDQTPILDIKPVLSLIPER
jgi:tRNA (Thr-GGU) A37 N-methylase